MAASHRAPSRRADPTAVAAFFADALNRERSLTDVESAMLASILMREGSRAPLRRWTEDQDAVLIRLTALGLSAHTIGEQIGRSADAIHTRVKRLKMREKRNG